MEITIGKGPMETVSMITECFRFGNRHNRDEKDIPPTFQKKLIANGKPSRILVLRM